MTLLVLMVLVALLLFLIYVKYQQGDAKPSPQELEPDPDDVIKAATELHAIRRRLDVAWTRTEMQRDSYRLQRNLKQELRAVDRLDAQEPAE